MPIEVFTAWTKWSGPTSPTVSGGKPAPNAALSSPLKLTVGLGIAVLGAVTEVLPGAIAPGSGTFGLAAPSSAPGCSISGGAGEGATRGRFRTFPSNDAGVTGSPCLIWTPVLARAAADVVDAAPGASRRRSARLPLPPTEF